MGIGPVELLFLIVLVAVVLAVVGLRRGSGVERPPAMQPRDVPLPADLQSRLRGLAAQGQKIQAIKELRQVTGLSLLDAKNTVDALATGRTFPTPDQPPPTATTPRDDLAYRARTLATTGRPDEAVRLISTETGMSAPEAQAFLRALLP